MTDDSENSAGRVLVHVCCATCYLGVAADLRSRGVEFEGYFYNPNVHPLLEFRRRLKACKVLSHDAGLPMTFDEEYGLVGWLRTMVGHEDERCERCYRMRLERTAETAAKRGFAGFTTTLLASPHQRHEKVREIGEELAGRFGVKFVYRDWRGTHDEACAGSKARSLYRQQYCGCIYSEYDRFKNTTTHLWQPEDELRGTHGTS